MKNQRDKSTPEHDAMLTDTTVNPMDRGWAAHLIGWDNLRHLEPQIAALLAETNPYLRNCALEALLRWGKVEYLDLAIHHARTPEEWDEQRNMAIRAVGHYAVGGTERRDEAIATLVWLMENEDDDSHAETAYRNAMRAVGERPEFVSASEPFDRLIIDWKIFEKYRGTTKGPTAH